MKVRWGEVIKYSHILGISFIALGPFMWLVLTSLKDIQEVYNPGQILPTQFRISNYVEVLEAVPLGTNFLNSLIVASTTTLFVVVIGAMAGYGFSRFGFRGNTLLLVLVLLIRLIPPITILIPLYVFIRRLGLIDTKVALVLLYTAVDLPTAIWICKVFFDQLPKELFDAAKIDGCSNWRMLGKIVVPLSIPALAVTAILLFVSNWNEFLLANTFTSSQVSRTLPVALMPFVRPTAETGLDLHWGHAAAGTMIAIWPVILLAAIFQRYLIRGLLVGSLKG